EMCLRVLLTRQMLAHDFVAISSVWRETVLRRADEGETKRLRPNYSSCLPALADAARALRLLVACVPCGCATRASFFEHCQFPRDSLRPQKARFSCPDWCASGWSGSKLQPPTNGQAAIREK